MYVPYALALTDDVRTLRNVGGLRAAGASGSAMYVPLVRVSAGQPFT